MPHPTYSVAPLNTLVNKSFNILTSDVDTTGRAVIQEKAANLKHLILSQL